MRPLLRRKPIPHILSFGGVYSNHVAALSAASTKYGFPLTLCLRGEPVDNHVVALARRSGADLIWLSRSDYRRREEADFQRALLRRAAATHGCSPEAIELLPEGGTTTEAIQSAGAVYTETVTQLGRVPDVFCLSVGTGGTAAGVLRASDGRCRVEAFPALRGKWLVKHPLLPRRGARNFALVTDYHFGGYGKFPAHWAQRMELPAYPGLPLEPVYTAKLFFGLHDRITKGVYPRGSTVVALHTGGTYAI